MPRSVIPPSGSDGRSGTTQPIAKARTMPRLMPRASSSPPVSTRSTSDSAADQTSSRNASSTRASRPYDFQVEVRVPLSGPGRGVDDSPTEIPVRAPGEISRSASSSGLRVDSEKEFEDCKDYHRGYGEPNDESTISGADASPAASSSMASPSFGPGKLPSAAPPSKVGSGVAAFAAAVAAGPPASRAAASPAFGMDLDMNDLDREDEWADTSPWDC